VSDVIDEHVKFLLVLADDMEADDYLGDATRLRKIAAEIERLRAEVEDLLAALDRQGKEDRP